MVLSPMEYCCEQAKINHDNEKVLRLKLEQKTIQWKEQQIEQEKQYLEQLENNNVKVKQFINCIFTILFGR